jgi:hypothetical protein
MPNIFCLSPGLAEEDRFTASLNYVIVCFPSIGQAVSDYLLSSAGLQTSKFLRSTDHPSGSAEDRPDFLLECEDIDIVCEHKINSPLVHKQLERYLKLQRGKPFVLALISNGICCVSGEVINDDSYISPIDSDVPHFLWHSIYPLIQNNGERVIADFLHYMRTLSMKPIESESWNDLFHHKSVAEAFGQHWVETVAYFKQIGAKCKYDPSRLAIQIAYPEKWLHLLYVFVSPDAVPSHHNVIGPYLGARIYVNSEDYPDIQFANIESEFEYVNGRIFVRELSGLAPWNKNLNLVSDYYTTLDNILTTDAALLKQNLLNFTKAVLEISRSYVKE